MAFFRKAGSIVGNQIGKEISSSNSSIFQAIRCMSTSKLFIGGISYSTDDTSLREAFGKYGEVADARVIVDRDSGRSRGFGFVTYASEEEASAAKQALDQQELHGRRIRVDFANDRTRGYGGGGGGYGGDSGYGVGGFGSGGGGGGGYSGNNRGYEGAFNPSFGGSGGFESGPATESFPASGGYGFSDGGSAVAAGGGGGDCGGGGGGGGL